MVMKIRPREIPREGLTLQETVKPQEAELDKFGLRFKDPITIEASVTKDEGAVNVTARFKGDAELSCFRCAKTFQQHFEDSYMFVFSSEEREINITESVRQEVMLHFPLQQLCEKDCKGLCPGCGKNLNEGPCECRQ